MNTNEFKPVAGYTISNFGGVAIQLDDYNERVRYQFYEDKPSRWVKLYQNFDGSFYFRARGRRWNLNNFILFNRH
jgi:hypothetical protein